MNIRGWRAMARTTIFLPYMRIGAYRLRRGKVAIFAYSSSWPAPFCNSSVQLQKKNSRANWVIHKTAQTRVNKGISVKP